MDAAFWRLVGLIRPLLSLTPNLDYSLPVIVGHDRRVLRNLDPTRLHVLRNCQLLKVDSVGEATRLALLQNIR
ncbi:hypothetical protein MY1884_000917 [Beauveria asiatica]